jgi:hypothetical protein
VRRPLLDNHQTPIHKQVLRNEIGVEQVSTSSTISGPTEGAFVVTEEVPANQTIWSACQDPLPFNINMQVVLTDDVLGGDSNSSSPPSSLYESGILKAGIQWRSC